MKKATTQPTTPDLSRQLALLTRELRISNSFKQKFIGALITGFGTVIGATILVALLVFILSQLASIELIRPLVQDIVNVVQSSKK